MTELHSECVMIVWLGADLLEQTEGARAGAC